MNFHAHEQTPGRPKFAQPPWGADDVGRRPGGARQKTPGRPRFSGFPASGVWTPLRACPESPLWEAT